MSTTELAIVSTMVVGVAAAAAPAFTAWATRKHERTMTRSQRLYEQRRETYVDIAGLLERTRLEMEKHQAADRSSTSRAEDAEERLALMARASVTGSAAVQERLKYFDAREGTYYIALQYAWLGAEEDIPDTEGVERWEHVERVRDDVVVPLIDDLERMMRDELATL